MKIYADKDLEIYRNVHMIQNSCAEINSGWFPWRRAYFGNALFEDAQIISYKWKYMRSEQCVFIFDFIWNNCVSSDRGCFIDCNLKGMISWFISSFIYEFCFLNYFLHWKLIKIIDECNVYYLEHSLDGWSILFGSFKNNNKYEDSRIPFILSTSWISSDGFFVSVEYSFKCFRGKTQLLYRNE